MEELKKMEELGGHVKDYFQVRIDEIRLQLAGRTAKVISQLFANAAVVLVFVIGILFAAVAVALAIGSRLHNPAVGFVVVAGFFLLLAMVIWLVRQPLIRKPVMNCKGSGLVLCRNYRTQTVVQDRPDLDPGDAVREDKGKLPLSVRC